jgi:hypothetical protein
MILYSSIRMLLHVSTGHHLLGVYFVGCVKQNLCTTVMRTTENGVSSRA